MDVTQRFFVSKLDRAFNLGGGSRCIAGNSRHWPMTAVSLSNPWSGAIKEETPMSALPTTFMLPPMTWDKPSASIRKKRAVLKAARHSGKRAGLGRSSAGVENLGQTLHRSIILTADASILSASACFTITMTLRMPPKKFFSNCSGKRILFEANRASPPGCTV